MNADHPYFIQDSAVEILSSEFGEGGDLVCPLAAYYACCALAGETESEPAPGRDGKPINATVAQLATLAGGLPPAAVTIYLETMARVGILDPRLPIPADPRAMFKLRLVEIHEAPMKITLLLPPEVKP
jgi:hypothetical protein